MQNLQLKILDEKFAVCKLADASAINLGDEYVFIGKTAHELSLVCAENSVPLNHTHCERSWRGMYICGELDFTMIGILAQISKVLADREIGILAISTYNTDYIFVKEERLADAVDAFEGAGFGFVG